MGLETIVEERFLNQNPEYAAYMKKSALALVPRHRLICNSAQLTFSDSKRCLISHPYMANGRKDKGSFLRDD